MLLKRYLKLGTMLGSVKRWLGIEGVKLELIIPEVLDRRSDLIRGHIRIQSLNPQTVNGIKLAMVERYARGRGQDRLTDEYQLGESYLPGPFVIPAEEPVDLEFELPFSLLKSNMDALEERNFFLSGVAKVAKYFQKAVSEYRIEAEAKVAGTALNPFDRKTIKIN